MSQIKAIFATAQSKNCKRTKFAEESFGQKECSQLAQIIKMKA